MWEKVSNGRHLYITQTSLSMTCHIHCICKNDKLDKSKHLTRFILNRFYINFFQFKKTTPSAAIDSKSSHWKRVHNWHDGIGKWTLSQNNTRRCWKIHLQRTAAIRKIVCSSFKFFFYFFLIFGPFSVEGTAAIPTTRTYTSANASNRAKQ